MNKVGSVTSKDSRRSHHEPKQELVMLDDNKTQLRIMEQRCNEVKLDFFGTENWAEIPQKLAECIRRGIGFIFFCDLEMPFLSGESVLSATGINFGAGDFIIYTASADIEHINEILSKLKQTRDAIKKTEGVEFGEIFAVQKTKETNTVVDSLIRAFMEGTLKEIKKRVFFPKSVSSKTTTV